MHLWCTCRWGADYLAKAAVTDTTAAQNIIMLVAQVGPVMILLAVPACMHCAACGGVVC